MSLTCCESVFCDLWISILKKKKENVRQSSSDITKKGNKRNDRTEIDTGSEMSHDSSTAHESERLTTSTEPNRAAKIRGHHVISWSFTEPLPSLHRNDAISQSRTEPPWRTSSTTRLGTSTLTWPPARVLHYSAVPCTRARIELIKDDVW